MGISGTVTASLNENTIIEGGTERILGTNGGFTLSGGVGLAFNNGSAAGVVGTNNPLPISGTVTANVIGTRAFVDVNAVTVSGFLAVGGWDTVNSQHAPIPLTDGGTGIRIGFDDTNGAPLQVVNHPSIPLSATVTIGSLPAISGTVTANAILQNANAMAQAFIDESNAYGSVSVVLSGSAGDIGVAGTVTAAAPNGSLTTRFGTPTTANVSFATSAVTNANRKYLLIQNVTTGSNVITVGIGFTPTTTQGIQLTAGAGITFESSYIPTGAVRILSSVTASNFTILEA
jgi:hypothetical protein